MNENRVIEFYKKLGLYNEELFKYLRNNTLLVDSNQYDFYGVFTKDDGNYRMILPKISSIFDEIVWVHEYAHIILNTGEEIMPNIMESLFINMYCDNKEDVIKRTQEEISSSVSEEHTLAKKIKLLIIK